MIIRVVKDLHKQVEKLQEENLNLQFQIASLAHPQLTSQDNLQCQIMQTKVDPNYDLPGTNLVSLRYLYHDCPFVYMFEFHWEFRDQNF